MPSKINNWRTNLTAHINEHREKDFAWGDHDCIMWIASCIHKMTGHDYADKVRGTYKTPEGAYKALLKHYDCHQLKELCQKLFGEPIHIAFAQPGDIVFQNSNLMGFDARMGMCNGRYSVFLNEDGGLINVDTLSMDGAFKTCR